MTENAETPPLGTPSVSPAPLFIRPREGRMVAGVCAGIAQRWGLDLTLVRIVTVALTIVSGVGLAAYVAAWLLTPSTDAPAPLQADSPTAQAVSRHSRRLARRLPALFLIVLAALVLVGLTNAVFAGFGSGVWLGAHLGLIVVLGALALVVLTRRGRWVFAGLAALLAMGIATVGIFGSHFGTRTYNVASVTDLRSSYEYGAGTIQLDLSSLPSVTGRHQTDIRLGRGDVDVTVPQGVPVVVHAQSGVGAVTIDGHRVSGFGAEQTQSLGDVTSTSEDRLVVDVVVGVGDVEVDVR